MRPGAHCASDPESLYSSPAEHARCAPSDVAAPNDHAFFGHPRGLSTLFFTEMWERFSYYGMRALLILFMTAAAAPGGLGLDTAAAGAIYGLYTSMVYLTALPGGWIADRVLGSATRRPLRRHPDRGRPFHAGRADVGDVLSRALC